jgi:hypothetical protein
LLWKSNTLILNRLEQATKELYMATHRLISDTSRAIRYSLRARGVSLTTKHRRAVSRILTSTLGRFERRVRNIDVWFEDVNGPRGGVDIRCRIDIEFQPRGTVSVSALAIDEFAAAAKAAARARELVDRRIKKLRTQRRQLVRT